MASAGPPPLAQIGALRGSVAMSEGTVVTGAIFRASDAGRVYVFRLRQVAPELGIMQQRPGQLRPSLGGA